MGRRSKHKQGDPAPLSEARGGDPKFVKKRKAAAQPTSGTAETKKQRVASNGNVVKAKKGEREEQPVHVASKGKKNSAEVKAVAGKKGTVPTVAAAGKKQSKDFDRERQALFENSDDEEDGDGFSGIESELDDDESLELGPDEFSDDEMGEGHQGEDAEQEPAEDGEEEKEEDSLAALGLPEKGKLSARQKKKALAEAERLEELLRSQGFDVDGSDDDEEGGEYGEGGDEDEEDLDAEQLAFLDGQDQDDLGSEDGDDDNEDSEAEPTFALPTITELQAERSTGGTSLQAIQMRIQEIVAVLGDFQRLGDKARSRSEYLQQLTDDVCTYYGYNTFLAEKILDMFSPAEAIEFFEANETPRPVTIRANSLRTRRRDLAQALINRGVSLEPVGAWSKVGLQVFESSVPLGATPEYLAGHYMLQAAASLLPCIALAPQPNERVLDMASAPGGKSTYLAALMQNTGTVWANDSNRARIKSLSANVHRLGCRNVVVSNYDGRQFPRVMGGFDRVLLDSPCSGTGVISKDQSVKANKGPRDMQLLTHLQKQLILCAIDSVNPRSATGGYVVYSTCSVLVDEDEAVVDYALKKRPNVKLVPTGIDFGREGFKAHRGKTFDPKMDLCKRVYPHAHNLDGFFVAKLKVSPRAKPSSSKPTAASGVDGIDNDEPLEGVSDDEDEEADDASDVSASISKKHKTKIPGSIQAPRESIFNNDEDEAIMQKARQKLEKKHKGPRRSSSGTATAIGDESLVSFAPVKSVPKKAKGRASK